MHFPTAIAAVGFASYASAHMIMAQPVPFGKSTLNNSPLAADGSDFPCKQRTGVYAVESASNSFALGSSQPLSFIGSATHGGGSCQVSITYDMAPTKNSVWKVIHSIEGGCPIVGVAGNNGNNADAVDPSTYKFTIPTTLPTGSAVLAWTWFNKVGNREMYMNCAPVTLTGASSKRTEEEELVVRNITQLMERDQNAYNALPSMFVANIGNGCGTVDSTDVLFPNPGDSLEQDGLATSSALSAPTGASCGAAVAAVATQAGSVANSSPAAVAATTAAPVATSVAAAVSSAPAGGVFATVPVAQSSAAPAVASSAVVVPPAVSSVAPASAPSSSSSSSSSTTSSTTTAGSACSPEGQWNCLNGSAYQRCASGTWSVVMPLAGGTACTPGISANINIFASGKEKREVRFSRKHMHRHAQHAS